MNDPFRGLGTFPIGKPFKQFLRGADENEEFSIEVHGNIYLSLVNNEQRKRFVDDTFKNGGVTWYAANNNSGIIQIDALEVKAIR